MSKTSPLYASFESDPKLEKEGIWIQYGTTVRGKHIVDGVSVDKEVPIMIRVARAGGNNIRFDKIFEHKTKPYKRMIQTETLDPELGKKIMRETYAETVVTGWENMQNREGEFIDECTTEQILTILTDLPDLFTEVQQLANKQALYRKVVLEEDVKN